LLGQFGHGTTAQGNCPADVTEEVWLVSGRFDLSDVRDVLVLSGKFFVNGRSPFAPLLGRERQMHPLLPSSLCLLKLILLLWRQLHVYSPTS